MPVAKKNATKRESDARTKVLIAEALESQKIEEAEAERNKEQLMTQKAIIDNLETLGGKLYASDDIVFEGTKLVIPEKMSLRAATDFIARKISEEEEITSFGRTFDYRPYDGAWCTFEVLKRVFGAVAQQKKRTIFGPEPPQLLTINCDVGKTTQIPWGQFTLPLLPGVVFETGRVQDKQKGMLYRLNCHAPHAARFIIEGIWQLVEEELSTNSLYRGKAFDGQESPDFVDVGSVDPRRVVYSEEVLAQLNANVWAQLRHTDQFVRMGIPLKRAVLLHGPFGTGKTLACLLTGQEAIRHGWTFIQARSGRDDLSYVLQTARLYQPCVVFYEDVDLLVDAEATDRQQISKLLDDFDGIEAKGTQILCVLTTNYPEKIHKGMARPGRLDAMIEINELDQAGVEKLVRSRIQEILKDDIDWEKVFKASEGYKPAFVTEFADRTVRYVIASHGGVNGHKVGTKELVYAAQGLRPQFDKMTGAKDAPVYDPLEVLHERVVTEVVKEQLRPIKDEMGISTE